MLALTDSVSDALALLQPEIALVLSTVLPLVSPITTFAFNVVGAVAGSDGTVSQIKDAASSVNNVTGSLLTPVGGALSSLL
jgi:ABC-type cobalt transport system substrate-binding protein